MQRNKRKRIVKAVVLVLLFLLTVLPVIIFDLNRVLYNGMIQVDRYIKISTLIGLLGIWLFEIVFLYRKYDKAYVVTHTEIFSTRVPYKYSPAIMSGLINYEKITIHDFIGTVVYLERMGYVNIDMDQEEKIVVYLNKDKEIEGLLPNEEFLLKWLFGEKGEKITVDTDALKNMEQNETLKQKFRTNYKRWVRKVNRDISKMKFYRDSSVTISIGKVTGVIYVVMGIFFAYLFDKPAYFIFYILGIILFVYSKGIKKRTKLGQKHFERWMSYKRYLNDFSRMDNEKSDSADLRKWQNNIPYAISLYAYENAIKRIYEIIKNDENKDQPEYRWYNISNIQLLEKNIKSIQDILEE